MGVTLYDVPDVQRFARTMVAAYARSTSGGKLKPDDWNELENEAFLIVCDLARTFQPDRNDSFAGYASTYAPLRVGDAHVRLLGRATMGRDLPSPALPLQAAEEVEATMDLGPDRDPEPDLLEMLRMKGPVVGGLLMLAGGFKRAEIKRALAYVSSLDDERQAA